MRRGLYTVLMTIFLLVVFDQLSKYLSRLYLVDESWQIFPYFKLELAYNTGIAFSLPVPQILVLLLTVVIVTVLIWQMYKMALSKYLLWAYMLIVAGAIGNFIDRVLFGKVTDFIAVWDFPIFNLADTWVSLGVVCFLYDEFFGKKKPNL